MNTGPGAELELRGAGVVHQRAGDVAGHQVGGELHALEVQLQRRGERAHQQRLGDARHALEQDVAAAQQRDHQAADHGVLTDDGLGDLGAQRQQRVARRRCAVVRLRGLPMAGVGLSHDCATCLSMSSSCAGEVDQVGVGRPVAARTVCARLRPGRAACAAATVCDDGGGIGVGRRGRGAAAAAAASRCAARRRRGRGPAATGTAGRGPRRSPRRAPRPAGPRRPAARRVGPATARRSSTARHSCRTIQSTRSGMRSDDRCGAV